MSAASVTIKLTPSEFDTLREAVSEQIKDLRILAGQDDLTPPMRQTARQKAVELDNLMRNMS
jgi:hypothetical protein